MIFAICGLTVDGTGTERAGTSSVWAWAVVKPGNAIAAHNSIATRSAGVTNVRISVADCFIALPWSVFLFVVHRDDFVRAGRFPCNPFGVQLFPANFPDRAALQQKDTHSILIFASSITLRQRSSSPRK
jgi:hypothetical protein